eukprot:GAHX01000257.1.p1 GENE.GAHX01000257.1~~GAHX01000257.1.p1  ORF type:complete len:197 (+),score=17.90 GAHX01000257.1:170-760(+)
MIDNFQNLQQAIIETNYTLNFLRAPLSVSTLARIKITVLALLIYFHRNISNFSYRKFLNRILLAQALTEKFDYYVVEASFLKYSPRTITTLDRSLGRITRDTNDQGSYIISSILDFKGMHRMKDRLKDGPVVGYLGVERKGELEIEAVVVLGIGKSGRIIFVGSDLVVYAQFRLLMVKEKGVVVKEVVSSHFYQYI